MSTLVDEPISTGVVFQTGRVRPVWFLWRSRRYDLQAVTLSWRRKEGRATILHLSVTDGATGFELAFNQDTLAWRLISADVDGCE